MSLHLKCALMQQRGQLASFKKQSIQWVAGSRVCWHTGKIYCLPCACAAASCYQPTLTPSRRFHRGGLSPQTTSVWIDSSGCGASPCPDDCPGMRWHHTLPEGYGEGRRRGGGGGVRRGERHLLWSPTLQCPVVAECISSLWFTIALCIWVCCWWRVGMGGRMGSTWKKGGCSAIWPYPYSRWRERSRGSAYTGEEQRKLCGKVSVFLQVIYSSIAPRIYFTSNPEKSQWC